uniref:Uncharacterized protein n=1 Tax=Solanum tuberosum TaxID=4113 RepID=M1D8S9_SOLTU
MSHSSQPNGNTTITLERSNATANRPHNIETNTSQKQGLNMDKDEHFDLVIANPSVRQALKEAITKSNNTENPPPKTQTAGSKDKTLQNKNNQKSKIPLVPPIQTLNPQSTTLPKLILPKKSKI